MKKFTPEEIRAATEELARRNIAAESSGVVIDGIRKELFKKQLDLVDDPSRNKAAICTRRAGKTSTWSRYGVIQCLRKPKCIVRMWAQTRMRVKELLWEEIKDVCRRHKVTIDAHETELRITFENRSEIRLVGADKDREAQKRRGDRTILEVVLEAQNFGPFLEKLVEDVVEPSTFDDRGTVCLEGTPGPVPSGYFFWTTGDKDTDARWISKGVTLTSEEDKDLKVVKGANWSCHRWSVLDNPHLPHARDEIEAIKKRKGWTERHPRFLREWRGQWVTDLGSLYYKHDPSRNLYSPRDVTTTGPGWQHVLGWDIGYNDAMALVVWGWHENSPVLYECASWAESKITSERVVEKIREFQARFNIIRMVADTGGGGRLFTEEVSARYGLMFEAAKKSDKFETVTLMNDDFISGRIKTLPESAYTRDVSLLQVDPNWDESSGKPPNADPSMHDNSHTADAGLYAWRYAYAFLSEMAPAAPPPKGSKAWVDAEEAKMLESMESRTKENPWWEPPNGAEDEDW